MKSADDRIIEGGRGQTPARMLRLLLLGCAVAAVFGSAPLLSWTEALPDGPLVAVLHSVALWWKGCMAAIGATQPYVWVRASLRALEAWRPGA